jgi:hypothetical protein
MFGLGRFVPLYAYQFGDSYFIGGSFSRTIGTIGPYISYELETGADQRFGSLHEEEAWLSLYARRKYFPWNDYVGTTAAVSTGLACASAIPQYEVLDGGNNQGQRLLHYFPPELTFGLPSMPDTDFVIRSHHRSGGGRYFGDNFPGLRLALSWRLRGCAVPHLRRSPAFLEACICPPIHGLTLARAEGPRGPRGAPRGLRLHCHGVRARRR